MFGKAALALLIGCCAFLFCTHLALAQSEGIILQSDLYLGTPIYGAEDLPEQITFNIYDAQDALVPIGNQSFNRGRYSVDYEFSKSDGVTTGNVARVKAEFTQKLNLTDSDGEAIQPKELWAGLSVNGTEIGSRTKLSDETMVQLLLDSDASIATYVTMAYEGDGNPFQPIGFCGYG